MPLSGVSAFYKSKHIEFNPNTAKSSQVKQLNTDFQFSALDAQSLKELKKLKFSYQVNNCYYPVSFKAHTNQQRNTIWSKQFDNVFRKKDASEFIKYVNDNSRLKPLFAPTTSNDEVLKTLHNDMNNVNFPVSSIELKASTKPHDITLLVPKDGHIQIENEALGKLFIERDDLNTDEINKDIIAGGIRGLDPFDQADWEKAIGRQWPTAEDTRAKEGVVKLSVDDSGRAILLDTTDSVGKAYHSHPRAFTALDSENNSVILAFQQENKNVSIDFAAWSILPFKMREGKKTLAIFPIEKRTAERYNNSKDNDVKEIQQSSQWDIDENSKFLVVDASKPSDKSEYINPDADWSVFATEGDDTVCLLRSCFKDNTEEEQFKVYSGDEAGGGTKYVELEFIAPKVKCGQKSTLVYRIDFVPLKKLGLPSLTKENFNDTVKKAANIIDDKIDSLRKQY